MGNKQLLSQPEAPIKTKKRSWGTIIFYSLYGLFVVAAVVGILSLMNPLYDWLVKYQASQPETKSQEIFQQYFADPNWEELYAHTGIEDTVFENKTAFASYMEQKVGDSTLTYLETSAGLSGDHKYIIRLGDEKVAAFTLTSAGEGNDRIVTWELAQIELFFQRQQSVSVEKSADETVYINGVALTEEHTVRKVFTLAEDYLPEGAHGYRRETQVVKGLLMQPEVKVLNAAGEEVALKTNDDGVISTSIEQMIISEAEATLAVSAAKAYALYAIRAIGQSELRNHFDADSQIYQDICQTQVFMQDYTDHSFNESSVEVSEYYRYSDSLFSARVALELNVTRTNGTVKTYEANTTYFFTRQADGNYKVTNITNIPIQEQLQQVRLTFMSDGQVLDSRFIGSEVQTLSLPEVTAPEGQQLRGWAKNGVDENGQNALVIVFTPTEDGTVSLAGNTPLEEMTLYPVFEKQES